MGRGLRNAPAAPRDRPALEAIPRHRARRRFRSPIPIRSRASPRNPLAFQRIPTRARPRRALPRTRGTHSIARDAKPESEVVGVRNGAIRSSWTALGQRVDGVQRRSDARSPERIREHLHNLRRAPSRPQRLRKSVHVRGRRREFRRASEGMRIAMQGDREASEKWRSVSCERPEWPSQNTGHTRASRGKRPPLRFSPGG